MTQRLALLLTVFFVCFSSVGADAAPTADANRLFGSREIKSANLGMFPKWNGALERYFNKDRLRQASCSETTFNRCHLTEWKSLLDELRHKDRLTQIHEINRFMNERRYIVDPANYGVLDYWATPVQFLARNGDCEDYAIAKFLSLRSLGFDASQLRIVVLQDLNLGIAHAVLVVYHEGRRLILDNQIKTVVSDSVIRHYRPIYSINETHWWLHRL